ncbi:MAG: tetratricopeptide repeat protein [Bradyrhizobium sp.]|uniref:ATP-binding protein n=1 Tax=Bradyrhizobium sp. TaxID=376 RepID=UPI0023A1878A|nr:ATP-binding protein [Bradyrhizobium sp.]MDE2603234.1 tetratricopeptide repeat protein [Bradyrhizobium sp.]
MSQSRPVSISSTFEAERNSLEDFAAERARGFVGRQAVIERLTGLCLSPAQEDTPWGICVTGEPGSGKSALFGELLRRVKDTDAFVLAHAAGASPQASSVDAMLRRWIVELGSALDVGDVDLAENVEPETVELAFASLLGRMALQRRVIVLIDALDQFKKTTRGRFTTWPPRLWPDNARFVATATPGGASKALAGRPGMEALSLPPLDATEAIGIIESIANRHQRKLETPVIDALLAKKHAGEPAWGSPLWLVLAVGELTALDADDPGRTMVGAVGDMPGDISLLYRATFDRAAERLGAAAPAFVGLIALSRTGWRESDLRQLLPQVSGEPWDESHFAALRRLFRGQIRQRGDLAQWDFNHEQMRAAAHSRLAGLRLSKPQLHLLIADHLLTLAAGDPLRTTETMVHLLASKDDIRAARYYGDSSLSGTEVQGATRALADALIAPPTGTPASAARDICRLLDIPDSSVRAVVAERFLFNLADTIEQHVPFDARLIVLNSIKQAFEQLLGTESGNAGWQRDLSVACDRIGDALATQGNLPEALKSFRDGLAIREKLAQADAGNADRQRDLAAAHEKIGDMLMAQGNLPQALTSFRDAQAIREKLARTDADNADWQHDLATAHEKIGEVMVAQGNLPQALIAFRDQFTIADRLADAHPTADRDRHVSVAYDRIGDVLMAQGNLDEALKSFNHGLAIRERLAEADHDNPAWQRGLSMSHDRVGDVLVAQGNLDEALKSYRSELAIADGLAKNDPGNAGRQRDLSVSHSKVGDVLVAQGTLPEALKSFSSALLIRERLARLDPDNVDWQRGLSVSHDRMGDVQMAQDNLEEALKAFNDQLAIAERLARADPGNPGLQRDLSVSHEKVGDVLVAQSKMDEALKSFNDALAIRERLAQADPSNVNWQRGLSVSYDCVGDVQMALGNLPEALKSFRYGLGIRERLARTDPGNAGWQRDLSVSYDRVGEVLEAQGKLPEALKSYNEGLAIADRLASAQPDNADWQRSLAIGYGHLGDVYRRANDAEKAEAALREGQAIMQRVVEIQPGNAGWKKDLDWFDEQVSTWEKE